MSRSDRGCTILPVATTARGPPRTPRHADAPPPAASSVAALGLHALAAVAGLAAPWLIGELVAAIQRRHDDRRPWTRSRWPSSAFVVVQAVLIRFATLASATLGEQVLAELREDFVDRTLAIPLSTVERAGTGDLLTRTSRDVDALSHSVRLRRARRR